MFIILLKFSDKREDAAAHMQGHNQWLKAGFEDGVFLLAGSLQPKAGGCILAHQASRDDIEARVARDPFVEEGIVSAEILEVTPAKAQESLAFLVG